MNKWVSDSTPGTVQYSIDLVQFNVEVDETNDLLEDLRLWKTSHIHEQPPPTMVIEIYIDAGSSGQQSLILQDELGHQWGVEDAIKSYIETNADGDETPETPRIVLERWRCQLGRPTRDLPSDLPALLPKIYKNSIVLFRSLFAYLKLLPSWELTRKRHLKPSQRQPTVKYRIYEEGHGKDANSSVFDELELALDDGRTPVTENFAFESIDSPAGPYTVGVSYRRRCDFRWERNMESVYSSKFIGQDEELFKPSLDRYTSGDFSERDSATKRAEGGSTAQRRPNLQELAEQSQAYGSMSTYHTTNARVSSSPMSALRAARELNMRSPTEDSPPRKALPDAHSQDSRRTSGLYSTTAAPRRTSVSFMPFKTHSLSASPLQTEPLATPPQRQPQPVGRTSALTALADARRPSNATPLASASRPSPIPVSDASPSLSTSPRPTTSGRYSSSFSHRRSKPSFGGSKTEDDNSSGRASLTSSTQPGSAVIPGGNNSSGSLNADNDNISDFLKMLDQTRELKSFQTTSDSTMEASKRIGPGLTKFQRLRDTNSALTESMTSSLQLQRASSGTQRQSPGATPSSGASGSNPLYAQGERMSPRNPHTPAVPSRLSANSIIDYNDPSLEATAGAVPIGSRSRAIAVRAAESRLHPGTSVAIDIPTSPRFNPSYRRSSSAVNKEGRVLDYDLNEVLPYAMRSASMGDRDERQALPMAELLQEGSQDNRPHAVSRGPHALHSGGVDMAREPSNDSTKSNDDELPLSPRSYAYRTRRGPGAVRGGPHGSNTSLVGPPGTGSSSSDVRSSRYSFNRAGMGAFEDEEPLVFAMSDFTSSGQPGRKSLDDPQRRHDHGASDATPGADSRPAHLRGGRAWS